MIDKQNYYHGAALIEILEHANCKQISKFDTGFAVNGNIFIFLKYTTKHRSPWRFTFSQSDIEYLDSLKGKSIFIALVCGGDGICSIKETELKILITNKSGWVSAKRKFREQYKVTGSNNELTEKVSFKRWPNIIFE